MDFLILQKISSAYPFVRRSTKHNSESEGILLDSVMKELVMRTE